MHLLGIFASSSYIQSTKIMWLHVSLVSTQTICKSGKVLILRYYSVTIKFSVDLFIEAKY